MLYFFRGGGSLFDVVFELISVVVEHVYYDFSGTLYGVLKSMKRVFFCPGADWVPLSSTYAIGLVFYYWSSLVFCTEFLALNYLRSCATHFLSMLLHSASIICVVILDWSRDFRNSEALILSRSPYEETHLALMVYLRFIMTSLRARKLPLPTFLYRIWDIGLPILVLYSCLILRPLCPVELWISR